MANNAVKIARPLVFALTLSAAAFGAEPPATKTAKRDTTADVVNLKNGSSVLGEFVESTHNGGMLMIVRRDWAKSQHPSAIDKWEKNESEVVGPAITKRLERMEAWKSDREKAKLPDEPGSKQLSSWIDKEIERLKTPEAAHASPLMLVKLGRDEIRGLDRAPKGSSRFLRLAWLGKYRDPEESTRAELLGSLEGRGFVLKDLAVPSVEGLLPPANVSDQNWLTKRAATELLHDTGLRLISYGGLVTPEPASGQPADLSTLAGTVKSALGQLLGADQEDPLPKALDKLAETGRVGAVVTELNVDPEAGGASVEMTLWVRSPAGGWNRSGSRKATVSAADVGKDEGNAIAQDPQVSAVFKLADSLGLGDLGQELKQKSLNVGAATKKALGQARDLANADLEALALPIH